MLPAVGGRPGVGCRQAGGSKEEVHLALAFITLSRLWWWGKWVANVVVEGEGSGGCWWLVVLVVVMVVVVGGDGGGSGCYVMVRIILW